LINIHGEQEREYMNLKEAETTSQEESILSRQRSIECKDSQHATVLLACYRDAVAPALTVATILFTAAADSSSPLGWSTSVMPRRRRLKVTPSMTASRVSVQFSGSSAGRNETES